MTDCCDVLERLSLYVDREMTAEEFDLVRGHLQECPGLPALLPHGGGGEAAGPRLRVLRPGPLYPARPHPGRAAGAVRAVLQRVSRAEVRVHEAFERPSLSRPVASAAASWFCSGVARGDTAAEADWLIDKMVGLRVFADAEGKMNLDIRQAGGAFLVVSQFTLLADTRKGRRPSFIQAAGPDAGRALYRYVAERLGALGFAVETGEFGAHMAVELVNEGPVTILLDSAD